MAGADAEGRGILAEGRQGAPGSPRRPGFHGEQAEKMSRVKISNFSLCRLTLRMSSSDTSNVTSRILSTQLYGSAFRLGEGSLLHGAGT